MKKYDEIYESYAASGKQLKAAAKTIKHEDCQSLIDLCNWQAKQLQEQAQNIGRKQALLRW